MRLVSINTVARPWGQQPQQTRSQAVDRYWSLDFFREKFSLGSPYAIKMCSK